MLRTISCLLLLPALATAQNDTSSQWSVHGQLTLVPQYHFPFKSPYSGNKSLLSREPVKASVTSTLFLAWKPAANWQFVFNPEMAGGSGLSQTEGIAGFPNGEIYRVGTPAPRIFVARLYASYRIPLSKQKFSVSNDINRVAEQVPDQYLSLSIGKFSLTDFFDNSDISHDPRTSFMNWSLMGSGGWDYPANTRGYTMGMVVQYVRKNMVLRSALTAMPIEANEAALQFKWRKAMGWVGELELNNLFQKNNTHYSTLHIGAFLNKARMGNYTASISQSPVNPDITSTRRYGRTKWGIYGSLDNHLGNWHHFIRASWNDGRNESWAFTEIDNSMATGITVSGQSWKRPSDILGIALVSNGISKPHRQYLQAGGYGFIIGDGALQYGRENIVELFYSRQVSKLINLSPDIQWIRNPAYNRQRGPVWVTGIRMHCRL